MDTRVGAHKFAAKRKVGAAADKARGGGALPDVGDVGQRLERALARIDDLAAQLFALQEQNQQLRKDLASHVCPRLCTKPYRSAS